MAEVPANRASWRDVWSNIRFRRYTVTLVVVMLSISAVMTLQINNFDTMFFTYHLSQVLGGNAQYVTLDEGAGATGLLNLPHTAYLLPFILGNERWAAFWVTVTLLFVLVGDRRDPHAMTRLVFLLSPYLMFSIASVNVTVATGFGLLLFLSGVKGWARGLGWAMLLVRPQDSLFWLIYDGVLALRDRDWRAFVFGGAVVLFPALVYGPSVFLGWAAALTEYRTLTDGVAVEGPQNMTIANLYNIWWALAFVGLVFVIRFVKWRRGRLAFRAWTEMSRTEHTWLLFVMGFMAGAYGTVWMIWLFLLPVREMRSSRVILLYLILMAVSVVFFRVSVDVLNLWGLIFTVMAVALLAPREQPTLKLA